MIDYTKLYDESDFDQDDDFYDEIEDGGYCPGCDGSGEGRHDGSSCSLCGGSGHYRH